MPIDFPNSPAVNDLFTNDGRVWIWTGSVWRAYSQAVGNSSVTSAMIVDGTIVNADVASNAAVAYSKLSLSNTIVNADVASNAAINTTKITNWEDDQVVLSSQIFN